MTNEHEHIYVSESNECVRCEWERRTPEERNEAAITAEFYEEILLSRLVGWEDGSASNVM